MVEFKLPVQALKGRGAATRLAHRFAADAREAFDDGWHTLEGTVAEAPPSVPTQVVYEDVKSAIARNASPDIDFDFSINPYRGCEHGCSYCYARPTHSYLNLSPGLDFETKIIAKRNLAEVLRRELAATGYRPHRLNLGSATDCYQPVERELRLTRSVIEVLQERLTLIIDFESTRNPLYRAWRLALPDLRNETSLTPVLLTAWIVVLGALAGWGWRSVGDSAGGDEDAGAGEGADAHGSPVDVQREGAVG